MLPQKHATAPCCGPSATAVLRHSALSFMVGWNPSGESGRNATRHRAKTFKCFQSRSPPHNPPWGTLMDKWGSGSSAVTLAVYFCHTSVCVCARSMHLQPCSARASALAALGTGCTCPSCPLMCAAVTGQQDVFLFTAWSHAKHVEVHAVKPGRAFRPVLSHVHSLQVKSSGITVAF